MLVPHVYCLEMIAGAQGAEKKVEYTVDVGLPDGKRKKFFFTHVGYLMLSHTHAHTHMW